MTSKKSQYPGWKRARAQHMKSHEKAASVVVHPIVNAGQPINVVSSEVFHQKKKKKEYQEALSRVLARAQKSDW